MKDFKCVNCSESFSPNSSVQKYCDKCRYVSCLLCGGKILLTAKHTIKTKRKYCSHSCANYALYGKSDMWEKREKEIFDMAKQNSWEQEEWEIIEDFSDYAVSSWGRIKRIKKKNSVGYEKMLALSRNSGYASANLRMNGGFFNIRVHQLVARAFIGKKSEGTEVNHKNRIKFCNYYKNLEYVTHSQNAIHSIRAGVGAAKLTIDDVRRIRKLLSKGNISGAKIAKLFNVNSTTISSLKCGTSWSWV